MLMPGPHGSGPSLSAKRTGGRVMVASPSRFFSRLPQCRRTGHEILAAALVTGRAGAEVPDRRGLGNDAGRWFRERSSADRSCAEACPQAGLLRCPGLRPEPVAPSGQPKSLVSHIRALTSRACPVTRFALLTPAVAPYSPKARICTHFQQLLILNPPAHIDNDLSIASRQAARRIASRRNSSG